VFFFLSKLLDVLLSPLTWGLVFLALAVPWRSRSVRRWKRMRAFGGLGLAILLLASAKPVANGLTRRLEHAAPSSYRPDVTYDVVVLLGGVLDEEASFESGQPSFNDNVERMLVTFDLLRTGKARFAIVSSAATDPQHPERGEAAVVGRLLESWGIPRDRILLEERARNTRENAVFSREMVEARHFQSVLVLTSAFHMPRSIECFHAVGMKVDTLAVDHRSRERAHDLGEWLPRASTLGHTSSMMRETFGRWIYRVQGYGAASPSS